MYTAPSATTCDSVASIFGITAAAVQAANSFVSCDNIWSGTDLCIPSIGQTSTSSSVPPSATCVSTYIAGEQETCSSIGAKYGLSGDAILTANTFLNCSDIWQWTPICIPSGGSTPCTQTISSQAGDTCDSIGAAHGVSGAQILAWNTFLSCSDIWTNSPVCVSHS
jgi:LysM repeat protein